MSDQQSISVPAEATGNLQAIQNGVSALLQSNEFFLDLPVITEKLQDIEASIQKALGPVTQGATNKSGACVIVITPQCRSTKPNMPGPYFDDVSLIVRAVENVLVNQAKDADGVLLESATGKAASFIAEKIAAALHHQQINQKIIIISDIRQVPDQDNLIYDVIGKTSFGIQPSTPAAPAA
jgi:hypothetical protein